MLLLLCMYVGSGLCMSLLAIPMIRGWLNPNPYYGFRVKPTLDNPQVWFPANRHAGWRLFVAGLVIAATSAGFYFLPGQELDRYAYGCLAVTMVALGWAIISSFVFLRRLTVRQKGSPTR